MATVLVRQVRKNFGSTPILHGVDVNISDGEFVVLVGPSGCGKSTLLRMIAGLEDVSSGQVLLDGEDVTNVAPAKRGMAMVFQTYALYPHLNVRDNMGLALKQAGVPRQRVRRQTMVSDIARLDIAGLENALVMIASMDRSELREQLRSYPATFPLDFTEDYLDAQSTDTLRHLVARLVLHCRLAPVPINRAG